MKSIILMVVGGAGLFGGTSLGLLAVQGRLTYEGTRGVPLISSFFAPPADGHGAKGDSGAPGDPADAHAEPGDPRVEGLGREEPLERGVGPSVRDSEGSAPAGPTARPIPGGDAETGHETTAGAGAEAGTARQKNQREVLMGQGQYRRGDMFQFPKLESGMSVDELDKILASVRKLEKDLERKQAAVAQQEADLQARENDIEQRQRRVQEMMREVILARTELDEEFLRFERAHTLVRQGELQALKKVAGTLANLDAESSSAVLRGWWQEGSEVGKTKVVKLLMVMADDAKEAILGVMTADESREILDRLSKAVAEPEVKK